MYSKKKLFTIVFSIKMNYKFFEKKIILIIFIIKNVKKSQRIQYN